MNSKPIKTEVGPKSLSYDEICDLIINFNPEIDNYTEQIESPKAGDVYLHYSLDKNKLDDWKSDGIIWLNNGQKSVNKKNAILKFNKKLQLKIKKKIRMNSKSVQNHSIMMKFII